MVDIQFMHTSLPVISCTGIPPTKGHWFFFKLRSENVVWLVTQPRRPTVHFCLVTFKMCPEFVKSEILEYTEISISVLIFKASCRTLWVNRINFWAFFLKKQGKTYFQSSHLRERDLFSVLKTYTLAAFLFCANLNVSLLSNKCKSFSSNTNRNQLASVNREPHTFHIFFLHENHWL